MVKSEFLNLPLSANGASALRFDVIGRFVQEPLRGCSFPESSIFALVNKVGNSIQKNLIPHFPESQEEFYENSPRNESAPCYAQAV